MSVTKRLAQGLVQVDCRRMLRKSELVESDVGWAESSRQATPVRKQRSVCVLRHSFTNHIPATTAPFPSRTEMSEAAVLEEIRRLSGAYPAP